MEDMRGAMLRLGVVNLGLAHFVAAVLNDQGYKAECGVAVPGACATHDLDVVAQITCKTYAIKTVFAVESEQAVTLQEVLASYATYLDLLDGADVQACPHFDEYWLVTNGVFSPEAVAYASHKGLRLIDGDQLVSMLTAMTYPVTAISGLTDIEFAALAEANVLLTRHLTDHEVELVAHRTGLAQSRVAELIEQIGG
ncbi:TPA: hypothetical protein DEP96_00165 [Candidatus Uhrbacteria bacterium]|nr:hypothetical protein [Candidatus Uhrbacteria bacterium]